MGRRTLLLRLAQFGLVTLGAGCRQLMPFEVPVDDGRLRVRPHGPSRSIAAGTHPLGLGAGSRDGLLFVPATYHAAAPAALAVLFHGATMDAASILEPLRATADAQGLVLLAVDSRAYSWDAIIGPFGADVNFIDQALAWTFDRISVDAARISFAGFSDGASYALTMGLINGEFASRIAAFSPGYIVWRKAWGRPAIRITHGRDDPILSAENTREFLFPALREDGYSVTYEEFVGRHRLPPEPLLGSMISWLAAAR